MLKIYNRQLRNSICGENNLYIHIPFCRSKCGYCNLFSIAGARESMMEAYLEVMERQAQKLSTILPEKTEFRTLTIGGGTPLVLSEKQLNRMFRIAEDYFFKNTLKKTEIIVETSPADTTMEKLLLLKSHGVTRLSMGVQSFIDSELVALHRIHRRREIEQALSLIRQVDFPCINLDLIYGIPGQSVESLLESCRLAMEYEPEELFVYPLYIRNETLNDSLYSEECKAESRRLREELQRYVWNYLRENGYMPVSMRCFRKNVPLEPDNSCGFGSTLSLGCGGRSYLGKLHFCSPYAVKRDACKRIIEDYLATNDFLHVRHGYLLSDSEMRERYVLRHILHVSGINRRDYRECFGTELTEDFPILEEWREYGYAVAQNSGIRLTEEGLLLSDYLGPKLVGITKPHIKCPA